MAKGDLAPTQNGQPAWESVANQQFGQQFPQMQSMMPQSPMMSGMMNPGVMQSRALQHNPIAPPPQARIQLPQLSLGNSNFAGNSPQLGMPQQMSQPQIPSLMPSPGIMQQNQIQQNQMQNQTQETPGLQQAAFRFNPDTMSNLQSMINSMGGTRRMF